MLNKANVSAVRQIALLFECARINSAAQSRTYNLQVLRFKFSSSHPQDQSVVGVANEPAVRQIALLFECARINSAAQTQTHNLQGLRSKSVVAIIKTTAWSDFITSRGVSISNNICKTFLCLSKMPDPNP